MQKKFVTHQVVYEVEVTNSTDKKLKIYYGSTRAIFKERHRNHKTLFSNRDLIKDTELSKYIYSEIPSIKWSIVKKINSRAKLNYCKLCLFEKLFLIKSLGDPRILKKKFQFVSKCCHYNKYLIQNMTRSDSMDWCKVLYVYKLYKKFSILFQETRKLYTRRMLN